VKMLLIMQILHIICQHYCLLPNGYCLKKRGRFCRPLFLLFVLFQYRLNIIGSDPSVGLITDEYHRRQSACSNAAKA